MFTDHNIQRERRAEADLNHGPSTYQPNALPLGQAGSHGEDDTMRYILLNVHRSEVAYLGQGRGGGGGDGAGGGRETVMERLVRAL